MRKGFDAIRHRSPIEYIDRGFYSGDLSTPPYEIWKEAEDASGNEQFITGKQIFAFYFHILQRISAKLHKNTEFAKPAGNIQYNGFLSKRKEIAKSFLPERKGHSSRTQVVRF